MEIEGGGSNHFCEGVKAAVHLVKGVKKRLFVFLQVTVVRQRQTLHRCEQAREIADEATSFAACKFGDICVLFLRQHRRASGMAVAQRRKPELLGCPEHPLLAESRQVHADERKSKEPLCDEVAIAHGIERVREHACKPKTLLGIGRVNRQRGARQRTSTERRDVETRDGVEQAFNITQERPGVSSQMVRKKHWLGALQVRVPRQIRVTGIVCPAIEHINERQHASRSAREFTFGKES